MTIRKIERLSLGLPDGLNKLLFADTTNTHAQVIAAGFFNSVADLKNFSTTDSIYVTYADAEGEEPNNGSLFSLSYSGGNWSAVNVQDNVFENLTVTGNLSGNTATFSGLLTANGSIFSADPGASLQMTNGTVAASLINATGDLQWDGLLLDFTGKTATQALPADPVTIDANFGLITTADLSPLSPGNTYVFTLNSTEILADSVIEVCQQNYTGTYNVNGYPRVNVTGNAVGARDIYVSNADVPSGNNLSGTIDIFFKVYQRQIP